MTDLPKGWALTTVGEAMSIAYGKSLEQGLRTDDGEYQYVGSGGPIAATCERLTFGETIVVGRKGTAGSVQRFPQGCWPSDTTFFIEVPDGLNAALIEHQLRSAQLAQHDRSTALPGLGRPDLEATSLIVPPLAEQERIVTAIEEAFSKLDAGEAGLRTVRQLLKRMRDAILTAAVTGRLVPQDPTDTPAAKLLADLGVAEISPPDAPQLPAGWCWAELGDTAFDSGYGTSIKCSYDADGPGVLRIPNIRAGRVDLTDLKRAPASATLNDSLLLAPGDLLIVRTNGSQDLIGRCAAVTASLGCSFASYLIRFRLRTDLLDGSFASLQLSAKWWRRRLESIAASSAGQYNLSLRGLAPTPMALPPLEEQARIVAEVERQLSFVEACGRAVDVGLARSAGLRRSVLKAAFEGRLVPQDPTDEPASALLDRVRESRVAPGPRIARGNRRHTPFVKSEA